MSGISNVFRQLPMLLVVVVVGAIFSVTIEGFLSVPNLQNIMRQLSVILVAVSGQTLVLLIGGIDLSVGAVIGVSSILGAMTMKATGSVELGLLVCVAAGMFLGALNGVGIAKARMQPFVMTFGMMLTVRAIAFLLSGGRSMGRLPEPLLKAGRMTIFGVPLVFIIGLSVALIVALILRKTIFGQSIYLTGSNPRAATYSGINVKRIELQVYLISGLLAGFAGFLFMMRLGAATPTAGDPLLLQIIGAAVLGGTLLTGGEGGIMRSITGCVLIAMLNNALEILGAQFWDQMILIGCLTAIGSALGTFLSRQRRTPAKVVVAPPGAAAGQLAKPGGR